MKSEIVKPNLELDSTQLDWNGRLKWSDSFAIHRIECAEWGIILRAIYPGISNILAW